MTEIASYKHAFIIVALYDTLGAEAMEYIVNQTNMEYIVLSADKLDNIVKLKPQLPTIKNIIIMDETIDAGKKEAAEAAGLSVHTFTEVEQLGTSFEGEVQLSKAEDIATICYTRYVYTQSKFKGILNFKIVVPQVYLKVLF